MRVSEARSKRFVKRTGLLVTVKVKTNSLNSTSGTQVRTNLSAIVVEAHECYAVSSRPVHQCSSPLCEALPCMQSNAVSLSVRQ